MSIKDKKPTDIRKYYDKDGNEIAPPTIAQRIQATRIMGLIGAALMAGFLLTIGYSVFENAKTIGVDGIVVSVSTVVEKSNRSSTGYSQTTTYRHAFNFTDREGVEHVADAVGRARDSRYDRGEVVSIGYYPDDFTKVRVRSWFGLWKAQLALFGLGLVLIIYSFWGVRLIRNEEQAKN
ncbi:MAG: DUF3592 domain-containing protein [Rhodobacteraceae bacterium]|nr:DUF3592 domain-containing protein [Paracoccaceae bacterium]